MTGIGRSRRYLALLAILLLSWTLLWPTPADARGLKFIRDAEIENIIRSYATPLFQVAGLNPQDVDVYLIDDPSLNAFVSGGQNLFMHTGLLMASEDPMEVIGVIAHETGHIAGGHIASRVGELQDVQKQVWATYVLGLGAALLTGQPGLGAAVISGSQDVILKGLLSYSRSQEASADQAAVRYLNGTQQSPRGLLNFMDKLAGQEMFLATSQDPYLRTHPLTRDRITFLEEQVRQSRYADAPPRPEFVAAHNRMRAKLVGFLEPIGRVFRKYPESDQSLEGRYARSIAYFRRPDLDRALPIIDSLVQEYPNDPYFRELKGQILFENGRLAEALPEYEAAVRMLPNAPQLTLALAQVQLGLNETQLDESALKHLRTTLLSEPNNPTAWRLSAVAYGRLGDQGMTSLSLAEESLARRKLREAQQQARRAQNLLPEGSPGWLRAQDLETLAGQLRAKQER